MVGMNRTIHLSSHETSEFSESLFLRFSLIFMSSLGQQQSNTHLNKSIHFLFFFFYFTFSKDAMFSLSFVIFCVKNLR